MTNQKNLTVVDAHKPALAAGARPMAIVPTTLDECYRLAKAVCLAGMAPRGLEKPEAAMVAILHGLECGLTPMMALQRIAVINGRPTIWGDGAMSLVRGSGLCEYVKETIVGEGDNRMAVCEVKRRGEPEPIVRRFSVADAKKAKLWNKSGPWQEYPERMMSMRARAFALRDGFADVLGGLYLREEIEEQPKRGAVTTETPHFVDPEIPPPTVEPPPAPESPPVDDAFGLPPIPPPRDDRGTISWSTKAPPVDEAIDAEYSDEPVIEDEPAEWSDWDETPRDKLLTTARATSMNGLQALHSFMKALQPEQRALLTPEDMLNLRAAAKRSGP